MQLDRLAHLRDGLGFGIVAERHTPGQVGTPRAVAAVAGALDNDGVGSLLPPVQPCLLQDASFGTDRQVLAKLARHRHAAHFRRMLVLPMAADRGDEIPTTAAVLDKPQDFSGVHRHEANVLVNLPGGDGACRWESSGPHGRYK